jgi:hypothetical protein
MTETEASPQRHANAAAGRVTFLAVAESAMVRPFSHLQIKVTTGSVLALTVNPLTSGPVHLRDDNATLLQGAPQHGHQYLSFS